MRIGSRRENDLQIFTNICQSWNLRSIFKLIFRKIIVMSQRDVDIPIDVIPIDENPAIVESTIANEMAAGAVVIEEEDDDEIEEILTRSKRNPGSLSKTNTKDSATKQSPTKDEEVKLGQSRSTGPLASTEKVCVCVEGDGGRGQNDILYYYAKSIFESI